MILSVVIPARNEFPNIAHTFHSIMHCWEADGFEASDIEVVLVDNCSNDDVFPHRGTKGTTSYLEGRGAYANGVIRVIRDPIAGNHSARNKGAEIARGKYLYFSDAHMSLRPGFFKSMLQTVKESGGLVHGTLQFMGAYPPTVSGSGFTYTIKLGEEIKGTWANYKLADSWFYVPAQGHWGVMVDRGQFQAFGGYPSIHRCYGGGEFYLYMKWWLFGSNVVVDPNAIGYHLASGRGYAYNHDDYVHNIFNIGTALGMDDWVERTYINYLKKSRKEVLDRMMTEAHKETLTDRAFIEARRKMTFNQLLELRPWEKKNIERHGKGLSNLLIYHKTWLAGIKGTPAEKVYPGKYQEALAEFIETKLEQFTYKR